MKRFIGFLAVLSLSPDALAASGARNGADNLSADHGSAWFLGEREIRYCTEVAADFDVSADKLVEDIDFAFHKWRQYLVERHQAINAGVQSFSLPQLVMNSVRIERCDGSQDLTFYFGVQDALVRQYLPSFDRPTAFAQRTAYDPRAGWGKGFIWVAPSRYVDPDFREDGWRGFPDWQVPASVKAILLHELGHVLGVGHVGGTVMNDHFNLNMKTLMYGPGSIFSDQNEQILRIETGSFLAWPFPQRPAYTDESPDMPGRDFSGLEAVVGRKIQGGLAMRLTVDGAGSYRLTMKDDVSEDSFAIKYHSLYDVDSEWSFLRSWVETGANGEEKSRLHGAFANKQQALGTLTTRDGRTYPVMIRDTGSVDVDLIADPLNPVYVFHGRAARELLGGQ